MPPYSEKNTELLLKVKQEVASSYPNFQVNVTRAWKEIIEELRQITENISARGPEVCLLCSVTVLLLMTRILVHPSSQIF